MRPILSFALVAALSLAGHQAMAWPSDNAQVAAQATAETPAPAAQEKTALESMRARLIGEWEEFSPSRNFVDFLADGRVVLYLKKGEIGELKTLDGRWTLAEGGTLTVEFTVKGSSFSDTATVSFEEDQMLLTKGKDSVTRHRKRSGEVPEEYRW